jgi:hypothetical protein
MPDQPSPVANELVVEVRYKPNARVLDFRGTWAEAISAFMQLPHWQIVENRIDIFTEDRSFRAFVGFRNAGLVLLESPNRNYFADQATKLLRFVFELEGFGDPVFVERLGVRSRFCDPFAGSFDELRDRFASQYVTLTDQAKQAIGADARLVDIGAPLNMADHLGNFNTMSGPMVKDQFPKFFTKDELFPDVGLYYDIDYWVKPERHIPGQQILTQIKDFSTASWDRHERLRDLLLPG